MPEHAHVVRVARYRPAPGMRDRLLAQMRDLAESMRDLDGLFGAQVCAVNEQPDWFALVSRWRDEGSLRNVAGTPSARITQELAGVVDEEHIEHFTSL
jgi:quinol monooxygenase YgiN